MVLTKIATTKKNIAGRIPKDSMLQKFEKNVIAAEAIAFCVKLLTPYLPGCGLKKGNSTTVTKRNKVLLAFTLLKLFGNGKNVQNI